MNSMNKIHEQFPAIVEVLRDTDFDRDLEEVSRIVSQPNGHDILTEAIAEGESFRLRHLTTDLAFHAYESEGSGSREHELEAGLRIVIGAKGINAVRENWRSKLITQNPQSLEDAIYEILVAGRAIQALDLGTVEFERPLPNSAKNSDIYGLFSGMPIRIETTVLHEQESVAIDLAWIEEIENAAVPSGFRLVLKKSPTSIEAAKRIRSTVEGVYAGIQVHPRRNILIDQVTFRWDRGVFRPSEQEEFIDSLDLDHPPDLRHVIKPCRTRRVTPHFIEEEFENPEGMASFMPNGPNHNDNTLSGKVYKVVEGKLAQMEEGMINVLALCHSRPGKVDGIVDALFGARIIAGSRVTHEDGTVFMGGDLKSSRSSRAPFCPRAFQTDDEQAQFSEPFLKLSAVWAFRLEAGIRANLMPNPNAAITLPLLLGRELEDPRSLEIRWLAENAYFRSLKAGFPLGREVQYWNEAKSAYKDSWRKNGIE